MSGRVTLIKRGPDQRSNSVNKLMLLLFLFYNFPCLARVTYTVLLNFEYLLKQG